MKIELWLIDGENSTNKQKVDVDLPALPRRGERIMVGEDESYEVRGVSYRLNDELVFTGRITVDAFSPEKR